MITSASLYSLDYWIRARELSRTLPPATPIAWPQDLSQARIYSVQDALWICEPSRGITEIGVSENPEDWTQWRFDLRWIGAGWQSVPVAMSRTGTVVRIEANGKLRTAFEAGPEGENIVALGLPEDLVVVKRYGKSESSFELWSDHMLWRREGSGQTIVPHDGSLYRLLNGVLERIGWTDGQTRWSLAVPARKIVGVRDGILWMRGEARLLAVDVDSGTLRVDIATVNNRYVEGVLDDEGLYHSVTGLRYQIYDLADGGKLLRDEVLEGASTAPGDIACLATEGRAVFATDNGHFFLYNQSTPTLTPITRIPPPVTTFGIAHGQLWILGESELLRFGQ